MKKSSLFEKKDDLEMRDDPLLVVLSELRDELLVVRATNMQLLDEISDLKVSFSELQSQKLDKNQVLEEVTDRLKSRLKCLSSNKKDFSLKEWNGGLLKIMDHLAMIEARVEAIDNRTSPMKDHLQQYHAKKALLERKTQIESDINPHTN
jgi:chromosome segregation ATPase